ncbi:hypothetical protein WICMUC_000291 [Wickerhamomyces mucosus]|uniref:Protein DSE1 n=1 Tax=Wickerhamomyces mucosus TaxID=1378264 RepID=A0A9P8PXW8_9ASCO|nr:hypothetical protein WICMUC_000291 [Wickerhamomyces mucosus]
MDFYKPNTIFRQNHVEKRKSCIDSISSSSSSSRKFSNESWLYQNSSTEILNKSLNKDNNQINSNYWKIPDNDSFLTSIAINKQNQLAISSGGNDSNLFIYNIDDDHDDLNKSLIHKQTISLPNITKMEWLNDNSIEESCLLTGHKNGMIHYVSIPNLDYNEDDENAQIIKRFNHKRHFTSSIINSKSIKNLQITKNWLNNGNNLISLCNENIFLWDINHRSDLPILKTQHLGLLNFDYNSFKLGILGLVGKFGIAINDLRISNNCYDGEEFQKPSIFIPQNDKSTTAANNIKWSPFDSNIFAASHLDGIIRLWDIRSQSHFAELKGHSTNEINSIEWSEINSNDLYSSDQMGKLIHWDLNFDENLMNCTINEGIDSILLKDEKFYTDQFEILDLINQRQCGTIISDNNNNSKTGSIIDLKTFNDSIISIDNESYLGLHYKNKSILAKDSEYNYNSKMMDQILKDIPSELDLDDDDLTPLNSPSSRLTNFSNMSDNSINTLVPSLEYNMNKKLINPGFIFNETKPLNNNNNNFDINQLYI